MSKWMNRAESEDQARNIFRTLTMGLMLGMAIGWVLLRMRRPGNGADRGGDLGRTPDEIDITDLETANTEVSQSPAESMGSEPAEPAALPDSTKTSAKSKRENKGTRDRLEAIKGIGPVFAMRMNAAGIFTYADLANQEPERLTAIVQAKSWQAIDPEDWIMQAKSLAK